MVYKYQEEGVLFDNVRSASSFLSGLPLGNDEVYNSAQDGDYVTRKYSIRDIGSVVNALDIDWNGAHINNIGNYNIEILNTTSDLLKWIKHLEYRISILENNGTNPNPYTEYSTITWDDNGATSPHSGGSTTVRNGSPIIIPTTNPKREYTITWNTNGGIGASGGSNKVTYGFKGWYTSRLGGSLLTSNTIADGDATYYALWTAPTSITLPTTNPTRSGYNFMGWATTSVAITPNVTSSTVPTGDITYYAVWLEQSVTLTSIEWTLNEASSIRFENIVLPDLTCIYSDGTSNTINARANGVTLDPNISSYAEIGPHNIYATYLNKTTIRPLQYTIYPVPLYDITFNANGGKYSDNTTSKTITITRGEELGSNIPVPTKEGYDYQGYATTSTANESNIGPTTLPLSNNTYYAVWKIKSHNVTLNVNEGTVEGTNPVSTSHGSSAWFTIVPNAGYSEPITADRNNVVVGSDSIHIEKNTTTGKYAVNVKNVTENTTVNINFTAIPVINLNPSSDQTITEPIDVSSTVTNGVSANTNWAITNEGISGETFNKSTSIGTSVTITPNDRSAPEANKGTVSMTTGSLSQSTTNGTTVLNASFTPGQNTTKEYSTTLTASYDRAEPVSINITFSKTTNALSAGTYTWSVEGTLPSGVQLEPNNDNRAFARLINTNSSPALIPANTIKVENANGTYAVYNAAVITVPGKSETNTYYWYVGKDESLLGKNGTSYNLNLSLLPTVNSINEIYTNSQNVGSIDNNIYVVCPTEWIGQFGLTDLDNNELIFTDKTSQIISGVTGYSILRGAAKSTDTAIKIIRQ